ncbi:dehydrogenase [Siculibacillus lacustris]|uniref:Dehydrogenase n=1 Tax=Siculibacillus lacustris TaxID=1549641 RepID=A0A4Q9VF99_9HYPH|nr:dehydrogenase [Siculibacillus lacustris]TBW32966.1 dehydrogenase [Siculibacillus lacustris]
MASLKTTRSRAPLRLGLAGGGTDLSPYCDQFGGAVLNTTIDRYAFAIIVPRDDRKLVFEAHDLGLAHEFDLEEDLSATPMALHRGVYERMVRDYNGGRRVAMNLITTVDAPLGSGLGSSSALVVALVDAFRALFEQPLGEYDVAHLAFDIERIDLGLAGGRQDQYAAAFGGVNFIEFFDQERVIVNPLRLRRSIRNELESSLVTCFSGASRESAHIISQQKRELTSGSPRALEAMHKLKADAIEMKRRLFTGDIPGMAQLLNESWLAKKATASGISTGRIDELYEFGLANGALGGKVSGAGGGGFMFFITHPEQRYKLIEALRGAGAIADAVSFSEVGAEVWQVREPLIR